MNLLTDSDHILGFAALRTILTSPNLPGIIIPLDTFENRNYDGDNEKAFPGSVITDRTCSRIRP
jgi:hypothetical protein